MNEPEKRLVLSQQQIQTRVDEMAREISREYTDKNPILVGVLNGVFMFYSDLVKALTIPMTVDFIRLASYGADSQSCGKILMTKDLETDVTGRHVLVVEDIADSGLTLKWLKNHLAGLGAASIRICVLINKMERRESTIDLDYVGFDVEQGFLVGYGLDFNGQYRNLTDIYHLVMD